MNNRFFYAHNPDDALNGTQKNIIEAFVGFIFDDIKDGFRYPSECIEALELITEKKISLEYTQFLERHNVHDSVDQIRDVIFHPYPQNRNVNYPYFGEPADPNMVVYRDITGAARLERKGLLGLTARNDDSAQPVTKEAVVNFIKRLISAEIFQLKNIENDENFRFESIIESERFVDHDEWIVTLIKDSMNSYAICLEGVGPNNRRFVDGYGLETNQFGISTLKKRSFFPCNDVLKDSTILPVNVISIEQGKTLRDLVRRESQSIVNGIDISCGGHTASSSCQYEDFEKNWAINKFKKINIDVDERLLGKNSNRSCLIL